jgi:hypothetical protein
MIRKGIKSGSNGSLDIAIDLRRGIEGGVRRI